MTSVTCFLLQTKSILFLIIIIVDTEFFVDVLCFAVVFIKLNKFSSIRSWLRVFIINGCWIFFQKIFLCNWIWWYDFSLLAWWCGVLLYLIFKYYTSFTYLEQISDIYRVYLPLYIVVLCYYFVDKYLHLFFWKIVICSFLLCNSFIWFS